MVDFPHAFPLIDGTKRPAVKWTDPAACSPWRSGPDAPRVGLATGPRNGFWVVDLDRGKQEGVDGLASLMGVAPEGLPETYTVRTPGGGLHIYWRWDPARPVGNPVGVLPGVDIRGAGGYVCAGGDYLVAVDAPIIDAPEWVYALATRSRAATVTGESAVAIGPEHPEWSRRLQLAVVFADTEPPCISGQGGQAQIWKMALRIMRTYELPVEEAMRILEPYNARCVPPWTEAELVRTLLRAAEEGQGPTGMFAADFMSGTVPAALAPVVGPLPEGPWRQVLDPAHAYTDDLSTMCAGTILQKCSALGPKEITGTFAGPGAPPPWTGVWQYDAFRRRVVAVNPPIALDAESAGISKRDLASVQVWLHCAGGKASTEMIANAIDVASRQAEFHPVRDYLGALEKVPLADAEAYFDGIAGRLWQASAARDALESGHLRRLAIAAVRRVKVPGTKVDTMLILAGEQGFRKSLFCSKLFGEYFLDQLPPIQSGRGHEASIAIEGRWGVEVAELNALAHAHESAKKDFITRCVDKYRPVFGVAMQEVPRQCVFIGTTNDDDFLTDPTGDTRYDIIDIRHPIDLDALDRDMFWACAVALEATGELHYRDRAALRARAESAPWFVDGTIAPDVAEESAGFAQEDPWSEKVLKWARENAADGRITAASCMAGLALPLERQDTKSQNRVKGILRRAFGASSVEWIDGRSQRCYSVGDST